jgi:O-antigen/teichoic acid export membrane protein
LKNSIINSFDKNSSWFLISNISRLLSGFIILGLITTKLSSDLLGTWYIIVGFFSFFSLLELGIYTVLNRWMIHFRMDIANQTSTRNNFEDFVNKWWRFYIWLSTLLLLISVLIGYFLFEFNYFKIKFKFVVWILYAFGASLSVLNLFLSSIINSTGDLYKIQKIQTISVWINVFAFLLLFYWNNSLIVTTLGYFFAQFYICIYSYKSVDLKLNISFTSLNKTSDLFSIIKNNKIWSEIGSTSIGMISAQLLTSGYLIILANHYTPQIIASYGLLLQLTTVVISFSTIWFPSAIYSITGQAKYIDKKNILSTIKKAVGTAISLCVLGLVFLFFFGPMLLKLLSAKTTFPANITILIVLINIIIDLFSSLLAQVLMSQSKMIINPISFLNSCLISTASIIVLKYFNVKFDQIIVIRIFITLVFVTIPYLTILFKYFKKPKPV